VDFEKKLDRLEKIVEVMEGGELSLEDSLKNFEEGVKLSRECQEQLTKAEQKVKLLLQVSPEGLPVTTDFKTED
jgi:exodeoxyribonuclease VII small subunit